MQVHAGKIAKAISTQTMVSSSSFLLSYPEIILAITCSLLALFLSKLNSKSLLPVNWPVVGMLPCILANLHHLHDWLTPAFREAGCTHKFLGPWLSNMDFVFTCDPANVNHVFNVNFANYPKGEEYSQIFDVFGSGIFNADGELWRSQRRKAHLVMSSPRFRAFVAKSSRDKVETALVPLLAGFAERGEVVDMEDLFLRLTFDMTCNLVFGVDPGSLSEGLPVIPFARAMDDAMEALFFRHAVPPPVWKLMRWLRVGKERRHAAACPVIDQFVADNISKKKKNEKEGRSIHEKDMLSAYMCAESTETSDDDDKFLRDTTVNLMLAGRDTTGVALPWFFWLLAKNPQAKEKISDELKEHSGEDITKLVYMHAALLEALRLYPPVPFEHKAPLRAEVLPSGHTVRSGDKILFSAYSMGRMEGVWGPDCEEFRPERWISPGKGRLRHQPAYKFLSFNCGPRTCLGKDVAFTQMKTAATAVIANFDVELVEGHVVEPKLSILLHMKNGMKVKIKQKGG